MEGFATVIKNLNKTMDPGKDEAAMFAALLIIKGDAMRITPRDTGNLVGSNYIEVSTLNGKKSKTESGNYGNMGTPDVKDKNTVWGQVGYVANYAPMVHEMPANTNWQAPKAENKFLEKSLMKNQRRVLNAFKRGYKV